ncbi:MAG: glycoside hydrolase family 1 protein [bacterium]|nr:glycoside hydrolase family 1 protein [bacterium]
MRLEFPKGFLWGAATSAHQVEGNNHNDWTEWELKNAERTSKESGGKYPPENYISGRACDHYNRFREDFDIVKSLNHNAHRFSIEWSRIEPREGEWDEKEIEHYRQVIATLRERGIEPFVTLWHWTVPVWFRDKGGWLSKESTKYFKRYTEKIISSFPDICFWITLNETNVYTGHGYWRGEWPPCKRSLRQYLLANHHLSQAHIAAYKAIKSANPKSKAGLAHNMIYFTKFPARLKNFIYNHFFLRSIKTYQDFIGVNYYFSDRKMAERSDMNWPIDPDGFYHVLKEAAKYGKPVYVTENGIADAEDKKRRKYIADHIAAMHKAIAEGIDVRGYLYWSLLDNFEWSSGFTPRFGLVEMNYKTMERHIRQSAYEYTKIIKENALEI